MKGLRALVAKDTERLDVADIQLLSTYEKEQLQDRTLAEIVTLYHLPDGDYELNRVHKMFVPYIGDRYLAKRAKNRVSRSVASKGLPTNAVRPDKRKKNNTYITMDNKTARYPASYFRKTVPHFGPLMERGVSHLLAVLAYRQDQLGQDETPCLNPQDQEKSDTQSSAELASTAEPSPTDQAQNSVDGVQDPDGTDTEPIAMEDEEPNAETESEATEQQPDQEPKRTLPSFYLASAAVILIGFLTLAWWQYQAPVPKHPPESAMTHLEETTPFNQTFDDPRSDAGRDEGEAFVMDSLLNYQDRSQTPEPILDRQVPFENTPIINPELLRFPKSLTSQPGIPSSEVLER